MKKINMPLTGEAIKDLEAGDEVLLSGTIYTARDQAHLRIVKMIEEGKELPIDLNGQTLYYCGPAPSGGRPIGSCGPTTSSRMDVFTPKVLEKGIKGMIGKGARSLAVVDAIKEYGAVYFAAPGGAGAYLSDKVKSCEVVGFSDLGPEALYKLEVEDFPVIVAVDSKGKDIYERLKKKI